MKKNVFLCFNNSVKFVQIEERQFNIVIFDNEFVINTNKKEISYEVVLLLMLVFSVC